MKNGHEGLKLMVRRNGTRIYVWNISSGKTRLLQLSDVPLLQAGNFRWSDPKVADSVYFTTRFSGNFFVKKNGEYRLKQGKLTA